MSIGVNLGLILGVGAKPAPWSPLNIPEAQRIAWYDAQDAATITLNGGNVAQINDKWGSGRNQVQATAANQPVYNATGLNGLPALQSPTAGRWMLSQFSLQTLTQGAMFFVVNRTNTGFPMKLASSTSTTPFLRLNSSTNQAQVTGANSPTIAGIAVGVVMVGFNGSRVAISLNGNYQETLATIGSIAIDRISLLTNGATTNVGSNNNMPGSLGSAIILNQFPDTTLRQQIEGWLAWQYGYQASLPTDHPFRNSPP